MSNSHEQSLNNMGNLSFLYILPEKKWHQGVLCGGCWPTTSLLGTNVLISMALFRKQQVLQNFDWHKFELLTCSDLSLTVNVILAEPITQAYGDSVKTAFRYKLLSPDDWESEHTNFTGPVVASTDQDCLLASIRWYCSILGLNNSRCLVHVMYLLFFFLVFTWNFSPLCISVDLNSGESMNELV